MTGYAHSIPVERGTLLPLLLLASPQQVLPQNPEDWTLIAGLALGTALIPQLVYTSFAHRIGAARAGIAGFSHKPPGGESGRNYFRLPM